jgi:hypothetical protein
MDTEEKRVYQITYAVDDYWSDNYLPLAISVRGYYCHHCCLKIAVISQKKINQDAYRNQSEPDLTEEQEE